MLNPIIIYLLLVALLIVFESLRTILVIIVIVYTVWLVLTFILTVEHFQDSSVINSFYSDIDDNIAIGNPLSWSDKPNPYLDITDKGKRDAIVYQGDGIALSHEDHSTVSVPHSMFYFTDYSCRPECCLFSPYSCNHGCVCWQFPKEPQHLTIQSQRTSPTS
jgi:hypothetical protein